MPVYEFLCRDCKRTFSVVKAISEYNPKRVRCPKCDGKNIERRWSSVYVETSKKS